MLLVREVWQHFMGIANWTPEIVQKTFYHFVDPKGHWMHSLNLKKSQVFSVMEYFGNLVSIGVPMALVNGLEKKLLSQGDCFTLVGSGADLNCLMLGAIWNTPSGSPVS
jgi:3-oxoacyl-[acyl-carrier-protein] synthase III